MKMFRCKLIYKGRVQESFFREGDNATEVLAGLKLFQWKKGSWEVELV
jgi:hypothetical protein